MGSALHVSVTRGYWPVGGNFPLSRVGEAFDYQDRRVGIMELPVQPSSKPSGGKNFEKAPWCYLLWGVPAVLVVVAGIAYGESVLSLTARGVVWVEADRFQKKKRGGLLSDRTV